MARSTLLVLLTMPAPLLSSLSPAFYRGFLRTPARRSCCGALCHIFIVCLVVEAILLTRFVVNERETLSRVLRADLLSETAAAYPEALVMEYRVHPLPRMGPALSSAPLSRQTHIEGRRLRYLAQQTRTHGRV